MQEVEESEARKSSIRERLYGRADRAEFFAARRDRNVGTKTRVVISTNARKRKKPQEFRQTIQYDFLQYIRIVYKWALANHDVTRGELDLLLYLSPIGIFGKKDFDMFYRTVALYQRKGLQNLMDKGWVVVWRERKKGEKQLYTLSNAAKVLCNRMHKMCVGEESIPETRNNTMVTDKTKVINKYYMDVIKMMNKKLNEKSPVSS